jgi:hypothetical protein
MIQFQSDQMAHEIPLQKHTKTRLTHVFSRSPPTTQRRPDSGQLGFVRNTGSQSFVLESLILQAKGGLDTPICNQCSGQPLKDRIIWKVLNKGKDANLLAAQGADLWTIRR